MRDSGFDTTRFNPPAVGAITITVTDPNGVVTTTLTESGWWGLTATRDGGTRQHDGKPYPVRRLERLGGGLGIMADDLLAGFYAAAVTSLLISIHLLF